MFRRLGLSASRASWRQFSEVLKPSLALLHRHRWFLGVGGFRGLFCCLGLQGILCAIFHRVQQTRFDGVVWCSKSFAFLPLFYRAFEPLLLLRVSQGW